MRVVFAGTAAWAAALVVLLLLGDRVDPAWRWTCVAGIVLAGLGLALMRWQGQWTGPIAPHGWPLRRGRPATSGRRQSERTSNSEVS